MIEKKLKVNPTNSIKEPIDWITKYLIIVSNSNIEYLLKKVGINLIVINSKIIQYNSQFELKKIINTKFKSIK